MPKPDKHLLLILTILFVLSVVFVTTQLTRMAKMIGQQHNEEGFIHFQAQEYDINTTFVTTETGGSFSGHPPLPSFSYPEDWTVLVSRDLTDFDAVAYVEPFLVDDCEDCEPFPYTIRIHAKLMEHTFADCPADLYAECLVEFDNYFNDTVVLRDQEQIGTWTKDTLFFVDDFDFYHYQYIYQFENRVIVVEFSDYGNATAREAWQTVSNSLTLPY